MAGDRSSSTSKVNEKVILLIYPDSTYSTLAEFMNADSALEKEDSVAASIIRDSRHYTFSDMDRDGAPELLTEYYTAGAHCCMVYDFFTRIDENVYGCIFSSSGVYLEIVGDRLDVDFEEQLGYFFTCFACDIDETLPKGPVAAEASLVYRDGTLDYGARDRRLDKRILANLEFLRKRGVPDLDSLGFDDGTRKAYANHLAAYYFNDGRDLEKTHALFRKYYAGSDSMEVWKEFDEDLANIWDMKHSLEEYGEKLIELLMRNSPDSLLLDTGEDTLR